MTKNRCGKCGNATPGDTFYKCKACGRVSCSNCANPEDSSGDYELGTCYCGADASDYGGRLFTVVGHIGEDDYDED